MSTTRRPLPRNNSSSSRTSSSGPSGGGGGGGVVAHHASSSNNNNSFSNNTTTTNEKKFVAYQQPSPRSLTALAITEGKARYVEQNKKPAPPRERRIVPRCNVVSPNILLPGRLNASAPEFRLTPGVIPPLNAQSRHLIASHRVDDRVVEERLAALEQQEEAKRIKKEQQKQQLRDSSKQTKQQPPPLLMFGSNNDSTSLILPPIKQKQQQTAQQQQQQQQHPAFSPTSSSSARHVSPTTAGKNNKEVPPLDASALLASSNTAGANNNAAASPAGSAASPSRRNQQQHGAIEDRALSLMRFSLLSDLVGAPVGVSMAGQTLNPAIGFDVTGDTSDSHHHHHQHGDSLLTRSMMKPRCVAALFSLRKGNTPGSHIVEWDGGTCRGVLGSSATTSKQSRTFVVAAVRQPTEEEEREREEAMQQQRNKGGNSTSPSAPQSPFSSFRRASSMRRTSNQSKQSQQQHQQHHDRFSDDSVFGRVAEEENLEASHRSNDKSNNNNNNNSSSSPSKRKKKKVRDGPNEEIGVMMIPTNELGLDGASKDAQQQHHQHGRSRTPSGRSRSTSPNPNQQQSSSSQLQSIRSSSFRYANNNTKSISRGTSPACLDADNNHHHHHHHHHGRRGSSGGTSAAGGGGGASSSGQLSPEELENIGAEWEVIQIMYPKRGASHELSASLIGAPLHTIQYAPRVALRNVKFPNRVLVAEADPEQQQLLQEQEQQRQQQLQNQSFASAPGDVSHQQHHQHHQQQAATEYILSTRHISHPSFHGASPRRGEAELLSMFTFVVDSRFVDQFQRSLKKAYTDRETAVGLRPRRAGHGWRRRRLVIKKKEPKKDDHSNPFSHLEAAEAEDEEQDDEEDCYYEYDEENAEGMVERPPGHASLVVSMPSAERFQGPGPDCSDINFQSRGVVVTMDPCLPPSTVLYRITETFLDEHAERDAAEKLQFFASGGGGGGAGGAVSSGASDGGNSQSHLQHHHQQQQQSEHQRQEDIALMTGDSETVALTSSMGSHQAWRFYNDDPSLTMVVTASFRGYEDSSIASTATASLVGLPAPGAHQQQQHQQSSSSPSSNPHHHGNDAASSTRHRSVHHLSPLSPRSPGVASSGARSSRRGTSAALTPAGDDFDTHSTTATMTTSASPAKRRADAMKQQQQQQQQQHTVTELELTRRVAPGATVHFFRGFVAGEVAFAFDAF